MKTRNISIILMAIIGVALLGCATAVLAQQPGIRETHPINQPGIRVAGTVPPAIVLAQAKQAPAEGIWNPEDPRQEKPGEAVRERYAVGASVPGVDATEVRPDLEKNGLQIWYACEGCQPKVSLLFPNEQAMKDWFANPTPAIKDLIGQAQKLPLRNSSAGHGQKWLSF